MNVGVSDYHDGFKQGRIHDISRSPYDLCPPPTTVLLDNTLLDLMTPTDQRTDNYSVAHSKSNPDNRSMRRLST